jgi:hypothetical protein
MGHCIIAGQYETIAVAVLYCRCIAAWPVCQYSYAVPSSAAEAATKIQSLETGTAWPTVVIPHCGLGLDPEQRRGW